MMMTITEFEKKMKRISKNLDLIVCQNKPVELFLLDDMAENPTLYDFDSQKYNEANCLKYIPEKLNDVNKLLNEYYKGRKEILARDSEAKEIGQTAKEFGDTLKKFNSKVVSSNNDVNPFKKYTDKLAETLLEKNTAYGDSFSQSVDDYGLKVIGIRLSDKYNRIKHLVNAGSLKENDESLEDTLLDTAGYAILALKYLKEHENENQN